MASDGYATSDNETSSESDESPAPAGGSDDEIDMEDLGGRIKSGTAATTSQATAEQQDPTAAREMLTPALRANLSKQGYKLIGKQLTQPGVSRPFLFTLWPLCMQRSALYLASLLCSAELHLQFPMV